MKYYLYVRQDGGGCDYTIGCGQALCELKSDTEDAAMKEAAELLQERTGSERIFEFAMLFSGGLDVTKLAEDAFRIYEERRRLEDREKKLKKLQLLKKELGV